MIPQAVMVSLKKGRPTRPSRSAPSSPTGGKAKPGQAFFMAKHSTAKLETWHIGVMTHGFDKACPGDVTNTIVAITPDKSAGSFRHQNRPKLPRLDSILPERTCAKCCINLNKVLPCLPCQLGDSLTLSTATAEMKMDDSVDTVIDIRRLTREEQALLVSAALTDNKKCLSTPSYFLPESPQVDVTPSVSVAGGIPFEDCALLLKYSTDGGDNNPSDTNVSIGATCKVDEASAKIASGSIVLPDVTEAGASAIMDFEYPMPMEVVQGPPSTFILPTTLAAVKPLNIIKKTPVHAANTSALSTIVSSNARLITKNDKLAMTDVPLSAPPQPKEVAFSTTSTGSSEIYVYREPLKDVSNMPRRPGGIRNLMHKVKRQRGHRSDKENFGSLSRDGRSTSVSSSHDKLLSREFHIRDIDSSASLKTFT